MSSNLRGGPEDLIQPDKPKRGAKPNCSCPTCEGDGFVFVVLVQPRGTVGWAAVTCDCDDGAWLRSLEWFGRAKTLAWCRERGIALPEIGRSKQEHSRHQTRRYFEMLHDERGLQLVDEVEAIEREHAGHPQRCRSAIFRWLGDKIAGSADRGSPMARGLAASMGRARVLIPKYTPPARSPVQPDPAVQPPPFVEIDRSFEASGKKESLADTLRRIRRRMS